MNNNSDKPGELSLSGVHDITNLVFESAHKILSALETGQKTTIKDLTDKVVAETKLPYSNVMGLVSIYVHQYKEVTVERGRSGGIYKGGRPKRIDPRPRCITCNQVVRKMLDNPENNSEDSD